MIVSNRDNIVFINNKKCYCNNNGDSYKVVSIIMVKFLMYFGRLLWLVLDINIFISGNMV